jgi:uncharacterized tellurite resistance protein B-like protein
MAKNNILKMVKGNVTLTPDGSHPVASSLDLEGKNNYLNALAVLAGIDNEISTAEKEYLKKIIKNLGLPEGKLNEVLEIGNDNEPDETIIADFMDYFKKQDEKYHLIIDAYTLSKVDGDIHEDESEMIGYFIQNFGIVEKERVFLEKLGEIIKTKNEEKAFNLLLDDEIMFEKFKSILLTYGIDLERYYDKLKKMLDFETVEWEFQEYSVLEEGFQPASTLVSNSQYLVFLNYLRDNYIVTLDQIENENNSKNNDDETVVILDTYIVSDNKKYLKLESSDIFYDHSFNCKEFDYLKPIRGIDGNSAEIFASFVSKILKYSIKIIRLDRINTDDDYQDRYLPKNINTPNKLNELFYFMPYDNYYYLNIYCHPYIHTHPSQTHLKKIDSFSKDVSFRLMKTIETKKTENKKVRIS